MIESCPILHGTWLVSGHSRGVSCLAFKPNDPNILVTGSYDLRYGTYQQPPVNRRWSVIQNWCQALRFRRMGKGSCLEAMTRQSGCGIVCQYAKCTGMPLNIILPLQVSQYLIYWHPCQKTFSNVLPFCHTNNMILFWIEFASTILILEVCQYE